MRLILSLLFFNSSAFALVVSPESVRQELDQAILVAQIHVDSIEATPDPVHHAVFTAHSTVQKVIQIKDDGGWFPAAGQSIAIEGMGGEVNGVGVFISGYARPYVGKTYRASLIRNGPQSFAVTGFEWGLAPLNPTRDYSRNRIDGSNGEGEGAFLYWDDSYFPIPYFISEVTFNGFPQAVSAIDASFQTWRNIQDIKVEFIAMGCSTATQDANDGVNNVIYITQNWQYDPAAIAITRNFYVSGNSPNAGLILDTDILLNATNHAFTVSGEAGAYDVQDIVTHEVGHFLGLGHEVLPNIDTSATMYAIALPDETIKRTLHPDDLLGIHAAYAGVGNKVSPEQMSTPCSIPSGPASCGAVHARRLDSWGLLASLFFLGGNLFLGRRFGAFYFNRLRS